MSPRRSQVNPQRLPSRSYLRGRVSKGQVFLVKNRVLFKDELSVARQVGDRVVRQVHFNQFLQFEEGTQSLEGFDLVAREE